MSERTTLIHNVNGYSFVNGRLQSFEALVFQGERILSTADSSDQLRAIYAIDRELDGNGNTLLPGFIDAHGHILAYGQTHLNVDVSTADSISEVIRQVQTFAAKHPELSWIEGFGWDDSRWNGDESPTAEALDQALSDRPVWLVRKDSHAGWTNTEGLRRAGIDESTSAPEGGKISRYSTGRPTGILVDDAMKMVEEQLPEADKQQDRQAINEALNQFRTMGLTSVHDACVDERRYQLFRKVADRNPLPVRIYAMIDGRSDFYESWMESGPATEGTSEGLTIQSVKFFSDGALGSRGAALIDPYEDDPENRGMLFYDADALAGKIREAGQHGFQVNIHAIGDHANNTVIEAHRRAGKARRKELRHRIEHCQVVRDSDIRLMKKLDLVASVQPSHAMGDWRMAEKRLGPHRLHAAYPWKKIIEQGVPTAFGSDFPIETPDPFYGMYTAVTRKDAEGKPRGGWYPGQRVSTLDAFHAYTLGAAYAARQEGVLGSLEPGKKADFVITDCDIFREPPGNWLTAQVLQTWVGGQKVYTME